MKKLLLLIIVAAIVSCSSDSDFKKGKKLLEAMGMTDVKNTGYDFFCCAESDSFSTGFTATAKDGSTVKGCFCSSVSKGVTIRYQ